MAKKTVSEELAETPKLVIVQVTGETLFEGGVQLPKGAQFQTTEERARALGALVSIVDTAE